MKNFLKIVTFIAGIICLVRSDDCCQPICDLDDLCCIQNYFKDNGECEVVTKPNDNPVYYDIDASSLSSTNMLVVTRESHLFNMNGKIQKFCKDSSGNLVMAVHFENYGFNFPVSQFVFSQRGKKSKVITEASSGAYNVIITFVHPAGQINCETLKNANISAYFPVPTADYCVGPKLTTSTDPLVLAALNGLAADLPTAMAETWTAKASKNFLAYLQNYICDFGVKPTLKNYFDPTVIDVYVNNDDDDEECFEPCANACDMTKCVRNYFKKKATCKVVKKPNCDPVFRKKSSCYAPKLNLTVDTLDANLTGLEGTIEKFCLYRKSEILLMTVVFEEGIRLDSCSGYCHIYQKGAAPTTVIGSTSATYPVAINIEMYIGNGITCEAVDGALVSGHYLNSNAKNAKFEPGPEMRASKEPAMIEALKHLADPCNKPTIAKEFLYADALSMAKMYLQKYICDFNLPLTQKLYF